MDNSKAGGDASLYDMREVDNNGPVLRTKQDQRHSKQRNHRSFEPLIWALHEERGIRNDVKGNTVKTTKRGISAQSKGTAIIMARSTGY